MDSGYGGFTVRVTYTIEVTDGYVDVVRESKFTAKVIIYDHEREHPTIIYLSEGQARDLAYALTQW